MCKQRNEIIEQLREGIVHQKVYQKQPWTMVEIDAMYEEHPYTDIGFAKVQYPDRWDAQYGIDLCVNKALASIARKIMEEEFQSVDGAAARMLICEMETQNE